MGCVVRREHDNNALGYEFWSYYDYKGENALKDLFQSLHAGKRLPKSQMISFRADTAVQT